ncbi:MAG: RNA recognition motif domain-containing protein [Pseudomonadota bacterium]
MINIYVGNLPYSQDDQGLQAAFEAFGEVKSAKVIKDMATGRSKGFGFVEMTDKDAGMQAIEALNDSDMDGRNIRVNEARPRERTNDRGGLGSRY